MGASEDWKASADDECAQVVWHPSAVRRAARPTRGLTVWITGLSGSGKSTLGAALESALVAEGRPAYLLDGDNLRHGLNRDLGFTPPDRGENVRRVGEVARMFADCGVIAIVALISPYRDDRDRVREQHAADGIPFVEIYMDTSLEMCESRDPKGMYARARAGRLASFTGVGSDYEPPSQAEIVVRPDSEAPCVVASRVTAVIDSIVCDQATIGTEVVECC